MQRAVFEGVSFAIKDCLALCPEKIKKATVCGGATNSREWMQILADILSIELDIIKNEGPALGGALLALGKSANPIVEYSVKPNEASADIYEKNYLKYKELYPLLKDFYKE